MGGKGRRKGGRRVGERREKKEGREERRKNSGLYEVTKKRKTEKGSKGK